MRQLSIASKGRARLQADLSWSPPTTAVRDGMDRGSAAIGGMDRQTLRDWVHRFKAAGPEGLIDNWTEGPKPRLSAGQLADFAAIVEAGPDRERDGVVLWRRFDLKRAIAERFGVDFHERYVGKLLKKLAGEGGRGGRFCLLCDAHDKSSVRWWGAQGTVVFNFFLCLCTRLLPYERAASPSRPGRADRRDFQKNFSRTLSAHLHGLPETTPIQIWFQMLCSRGSARLESLTSGTGALACRRMFAIRSSISLSN